VDAEPVVRDATVVLDGLRFHYRDWGDPAAPPLVLLHAYTQHARTWDTVARGLADRFRVLALDHRGFGESEWAADYHELRVVADLAEFVDALGLGTFAAVGFSMSASTAASYAVLYPERVRRLVLMEGFTEGDEQGSEPWIQDMRDHMGRLRSLPRTFAAVEDAMADFRPLAPHAAEEELRHWVGDGLRRGPDGRWTWRQDPALGGPGQRGRLNAPQDVLRSRLAGVACPMLLLAGAESWMVEPTRRMAAANPRARVVIVPAAGHWVPLDNPTGFLDAVRGFLAEEA
jgi:pimeloyl-ACP methyl ester carboxylesterase